MEFITTRLVQRGLAKAIFTTNTQISLLLSPVFLLATNF